MQQTRLDPEVLSMVLDSLDKLERDKITLEAKLEMDRVGEFPEKCPGPQMGISGQVPGILNDFGGNTCILQKFDNFFGGMLDRPVLHV